MKKAIGNFRKASVKTIVGRKATRRKVGVSVLLALTVLGAYARTEAQTASSRFEAGVQGSLLQFSPLPYSEIPAYISIFGLGARGDWNISHYLAIEGEMDWYPRHLSPLYDGQEGGRTLQVQVGPKVSIYRGEHWSLFGTVQPGMVRFSHECIPIVIPPTTFSCRFGPVASFALELGGGLEIYPTKRLILRVDVQDGLIAMYERSATIHYNQYAESSFALVGDLRPSLHIGMGLSYRFGRLQDDREKNTAKGSRDGRFEVGGQFGSLTKGNSWDASIAGYRLNTGLGGGGRFTYNLRPQVGLDATLMYFPNSEGRLVSFQSGGNALEGLFGVKTGFRRGKVGYFAKARPGFLHFDETLAHYFSFQPVPAQLPFTPITHFVLDVGGVVEVYTSKRTMLRFDAGDTIWRIGPREVVGLYPQNVIEPGNVRNTIQLTTGFAVRF